MDYLRSWVISICTTVVFMTAVEIILPKNSMKKYTKFVLGLILISVILNPIIKLLDKKNSYENYMGNFYDKLQTQSNTENEMQKYKNNDISKTLKNFKTNIESNCEKKLKEKYSDSSFKVTADVYYDNKNENFIIKGVDVGVKNGSVDNVQTVIINNKEKDNSNTQDDSKAKEIKNYLSKELDVQEDSINVHKL